MDQSKSWTVLREDKVYETNWISVHDYDVLAPTGHKGVYGKVHIKNFAIGVLPVDENGWTYLVGQNRFCFDAWSWELPEGGGKRTDPPLETAKRELAEEIQIQAESYLPLLEDVQFSNSVTDEVGYAYLAWGLSPCPGKPDETELLSVKHLPLKEVYEMMDQGILTDMFTVAMLSKAYYLANTGRLPKEIVRAFPDV